MDGLAEFRVAVELLVHVAAHYLQGDHEEAPDDSVAAAGDAIERARGPCLDGAPQRIHPDNDEEHDESHRDGEEIRAPWEQSVDTKSGHLLGQDDEAQQDDEPAQGRAFGDVVDPARDGAPEGGRPEDGEEQVQNQCQGGSQQEVGQEGRGQDGPESAGIGRFLLSPNRQRDSASIAMGLGAGHALKSAHYDNES
jgi:hypothetical protein